MKKGISPLIATVLLILFVVMLGATVYYWASTSLEKAKGQAEEEMNVMEASSKIDYTVDDATYVYSGNVLKLIQGLVIGDVKKIRISLTNNGDFEIEAFIVRVYDTNGEVYVDNNFVVNLESFQHKEVEFKYDASKLSEVDYIEIIPKVGDKAIESKALKIRPHN